MQNIKHASKQRKKFIERGPTEWQICFFIKFFVSRKVSKIFQKLHRRRNLHEMTNSLPKYRNAWNFSIHHPIQNVHSWVLINLIYRKVKGFIMFMMQLVKHSDGTLNAFQIKCFWKAFLNDLIVTSNIKKYVGDPLHIFK